jgi:serine/threonine protein kinase
LPAIPGYAILGFVGSGGQGDVYRARHLGLDHTVALKILRDSHGTGHEQLARFRREAHVIARLDHPGIVRIHGFDESSGRFFLSMEYLAGGSLKERLGRPGFFSPETAVDLLSALAAAVDHAHQKGIVHRDLKPGNVLFTLDGRPKIVDFGVAKVLNETSGHQTRTGAVLGSPSYMAPEQAAGKISQVGPATDVYALGAILYELLAGQPPFVGESWLDTLDRVRFQPVEPPSRWRPNVPPELERICLQCLEKVPERRYASASQLGVALQRLAAAAELAVIRPVSKPDMPLADVVHSVANPASVERSASADRSGQREGGAKSSDDTPTSGRHVGPEHHEGYELLWRMHAGAFSEVWTALAPGGVKVAVKIHYQSSEKDEQHARALDLVKNLKHPYLLKTQTYWIHDGRLHVVMELADGSLRGRLKKRARHRKAGFPASELLPYLKEAAEALDYLHGRGLLHRNVSPDNILLLEGHVKVGDFSLVCEEDAPSGPAGSTPGYMAPECYRGSFTPRSDQYSLAISYVELRRGRRPFPARTTLDEAMTDAVEGSPDLGDLGKTEKAVLLRALAKDPDERYPNCREFAAAVSGAVGRS